MFSCALIVRAGDASAAIAIMALPMGLIGLFISVEVFRISGMNSEGDSSIMQRYFFSVNSPKTKSGRSG
jgi:hypothetical protein